MGFEGDLEQIAFFVSSVFSDLDETRLNEFVSLFKQISYFAIFAHAEQVSDQTNSKFEAWEWVKQHVRMYLDAPKEA